MIDNDIDDYDDCDIVDNDDDDCDNDDDNYNYDYKSWLHNLTTKVLFLRLQFLLRCRSKSSPDVD